MISFVYGTTAELIKIAPVYFRALEHGVKPSLWCTGQQMDELPESSRRLGMPEPDIWLARGVDGRSLKRGGDVPGWLFNTWRGAERQHHELSRILWSDDLPPLVMVHGDTMTTVIGALLGRRLGATVGHIEAGMRSRSLREPFPEELDRRIAGRLSHIHFTPGLDKVPNLRNSRGVKVDTVVNTVFDSLRMVPDNAGASVPGLPPKYGLVLLHRFELLRNRKLLTQTYELLSRRAAENIPMVVVADAQSGAALEDAGITGIFNSTTFIRAGKQAYFDFVPLVRNAEFVITDSGGLQEECYYLNKPCLVHRTTTEQAGGIGDNILLSLHDVDVVDRFLNDYGRYRSEEVASFPSPTDIICEHLVRAGHLPDHTEIRQPRDLSVIIPVTGGGEFIRSMLRTVIADLEKSGRNFEVILVSDGTTDQTVSEARTIDDDRLTVLHYAQRAGKGFAIRFGFSHASGELIAVIASDLVFLPESLSRLADVQAATGAAIVNGTKLHAESDVPLHPLRRRQTEAFSALNRRLFGVTVSDPQNGMKLFTREALAQLLPVVQNNGFTFDVEMLAAAQRRGMVVAEGPVTTLTDFMPTRRITQLARILAGVGELVLLRFRTRGAGSAVTTNDRRA